jgi:GH24 family phage-related lysozyme (muramidase)
MEASGHRDLIPEDAARAANWKSFGVGIPVAPGQVPEGAVVVFAPGPGTGGSGHVAFFSKFTNNGASVEVLGGNQSDAVNRKPFRTSRIVAVRWVETAPTPAEEIAAEGNVQPSDAPISDEAIKLIIEFEISGKDAYERKYRRPIWPKGASGVTIGIGYDVGHQSVAQLRADCAGILAAGMVATLERACGVQGAAASSLAQQMSSVDVSWDQAIELFKRKSLPRWVGLVKSKLENTDQLSKDSLGALVSLTYNRGAGGYTLQKPRFAEMRNIRAHMAARQFASIPDEFLNMRRLWPDLRGLQRRREKEAELFKRGLR